MEIIDFYSRRIRDFLRTIIDDGDIILHKFRYLFPFFKIIVPHNFREYLKEKIRNHQTNEYFYDEMAGDISIEMWLQKKHLISIIIPCYNYGEYVEEAVRSILRSTFQDFEIIIIDDGSTDKYTIQILNRIHGEKIKIIHQPNQGLVNARNNGIKIAQGKYICCLDADDTIESTYIEKCIEVLESQLEIGFVYSLVRIFGDENKIWYTRHFEINRLLKYNYISVSAIFRKELWERVGGYNPNMTYGYEDWDFWLSISETGTRGFLIREVLFNHRRHGKTMTYGAKEKYRYLVSQIRKNHRVLYGRDSIKKIVEEYKSFFVKNYPLNTIRKDQFVLKNKKRILFLIPWISIGGSESVFFEILKGLNNDFDFFFVTTLVNKNEWHEKFYRYTKYIYHLPFFLQKCYWKNFILNFIRVKNIDTVIISNSQFGYDMIKHIRSVSKTVKILSILHNDSCYGYMDESARNDVYINGHICVSEKIKKSLLKKYPVQEEDIYVIYNTVDAKNIFNPELYKSSASLEKFRLPKNKKNIAWIGRFSKEKSPIDFVKLAKKMQDTRDIFFVMFGDGFFRGDVKRESRFLKNFKLFDFNNEIPEVLSCVYALIITSKIEGFPIVALEAQAMGIPVIATNVGEVKKIIIDGENGYVVNSGDIHGMISKIHIISDMKRDDIRNNFLKNFPLEEFLKKYRSVVS